MDAKITFAASVQAKKGRLYAVIQVKENGKIKSVWRILASRRYKQNQRWTKPNRMIQPAKDSLSRPQTHFRRYFYLRKQCDGLIIGDLFI